MYQDVDPPYHDPNYEVTVLRAPLKQIVQLPRGWFHHVQGPVFEKLKVGPLDHDLTRQHSASPLGERIIIFGRVTDSDERPVRNALIETWQANAAGRYVDPIDLWGFPLDPNFTGAGRCLTDFEGRYRLVTIRPGAYPTFYRTGEKGWRAAHIHFSLYGAGFDSRLITQMYFEGDPLLRQDRMLLGIPDVRGQDRLIAKLEDAASVIDVINTANAASPMDETGRLVARSPLIASTPPAGRNESALAYRFDIVLRGSGATPLEDRE